MSEDDVDVLALRLSASTARPLVRRQHRERRKDKRDKARAKAMAEGGDAANAIAIPSSPSPSPLARARARAMSVISIQSGASDDEFEEVEIPSAHAAYSQDEDVEQSYLTEEEEEEARVIRLEIGGSAPTEEEQARARALALRKKPITAKDRAARMEVHKLHTICLIAAVRIRNRWASDDLLKARLLSLLPHHLHSAFSISPKRFPDRAQRSRLFFEALQNLTNWWSRSFFDISDDTLGMRTRSWDEVQGILDTIDFSSLGESSRSQGEATEDRKGKGKAKDERKKKKKEHQDAVLQALEDAFGGERLRSINSMMKKALQQEGSRDVSAQLFLSLARACGLGARLVASLQPVPWRAEKAAPKPKRTRAARQGMGTEPFSGEDELEEVPISAPPGSDEKFNPFKLRKPRPAPQTPGGKTRKPKREVMMAHPPVFWAEIFNRVDQRWIPVDPVAGIVRKKAQYDPGSDSGPVRMVYVVAFEEDGYARDVTLRYAKNFGARTTKLRPPVRAGETEDWWTGIARFLHRPQTLNRDQLEDAELEMSQVNESMPLVMSGFKDHPLYVLERHLRQNEVIQPKREIGRFKGEAVFRRNCVLHLKTPETWMRVGRRIKIRQEPLKWIKQRAVTIQNRRAQELANAEGLEPVMQGLYAEYQTELYIPPPIENGIIPRNAFGNIDLYTPTMLPEGAVHLPYKGIAKVAKGLSISYAEAVTSFEFKRLKATPILTGIVVAKESEDAVLEAYWKSAAAAEEREKARRETQALKRWAKLVNGLRIRTRLRAVYGDGEDLQQRAVNPMTQEQARTARSIIATANKESSATWRANAIDRLERETDGEGEDVKPDVGDGPADAAVVPVAEAVVEPESQTSEPSQPSQPPARPQLRVPTRGMRIRIKLPGRTPGSTPVSQPLLGTTNGSSSSLQPQPSSTPANGTANGKTKATPKIKATPKATPKVKPKATPKAKGRGQKRQRKGESESESDAEDTDGDDPAAPAPVAASSTRTLRSRGPKTAEQLAAEEEKRNRMREALASDDDYE